jgi:phosphoglycolate phosphatase-like HAD superfamily hydrolase
LQVVIFDLDGTLADINHRRIHLSSHNPNWKSFNSAMADDVPNKPIVNLYKTLWDSQRYQLVIVSGRSDEYRKFTEQWLSWNEIPFSELIMRKKSDSRSDHIVKEEILKQIQSLNKEIAFVVDDRQQVVDMWRRNGITCLQCDTGDF